jgi:hypothetical protein
MPVYGFGERHPNVVIVVSEIQDQSQDWIADHPEDVAIQKELGTELSSLRRAIPDLTRKRLARLLIKRKAFEGMTELQLEVLLLVTENAAAKGMPVRLRGFDPKLLVECGFNDVESVYSTI